MTGLPDRPLPSLSSGLAGWPQSAAKFPLKMPGAGFPDMVNGSVYRQRTLAWHGIAALAFVLIGVGSLYIAETGPLKEMPALRSVVSSIGGLAIASLGLGIVWELFGKRALVDEVFESASISNEVQSAKLFGVTTQFQEGVNWGQLLEGAKDLELMVGAARTWRNTLAHSLNKLASRGGAKITLILPDPESDSVIQELATRFGVDKNDVAKAISEAEQYFKNLADQNGMRKNSLTIWYLAEAPLYTFYRVDDSYVLALYRHGGKGDVPTFVSRKGGCLAEFIEEQKAQIFNKKSELARLVYPVPSRADTVQVDTSQTQTASTGDEDS